MRKTKKSLNVGTIQGPLATEIDITNSAWKVPPGKALLTSINKPTLAARAVRLYGWQAENKKGGSNGSL